MKAAKWIDRVKAARGWDSDYRAAKELGLGRATISKYRALGGTLDEATALRVAEALGEDPAVILVDQVRERTRNPEARTALGRVLAAVTGEDPDGRPTGPILDITSVTGATDAGELRARRSKGIRIVSTENTALHRLARALFALSTPGPAALA